MVKIKKCHACRSAKQKCMPENRPWDANIREKCINCRKGNRQCGPNEHPLDSPSRFEVGEAQQLNDKDSTASGKDVKTVKRRVRDSPGSHRVPGDIRELREMMKALDSEAELAKHIQREYLDLQNNVLNEGRDLCQLTEFRHAIAQSLLSKLNVVEALGDRVASIGDVDLAEIAYVRVLEIYRTQDLPTGSFIRTLLMKMASFYWKTDQPLRAEKCWWEIFELRYQSGQVQSIEKEVWQKLAVSLSKTSRIISDSLQSRYPDHFPQLNIDTPFPLVHRMIKSEKVSNEPYRSLCDNQFSEFGVSPNIHAVIKASEQNVTEVIQSLSKSDLSTRDILSRTPLFFATYLKHEEAGYALLSRIAARSPALQRQDITARDFSGQTILGMAIRSDCSLRFIEALIEHGAEVDPECLLEESSTPLQAACVAGRPDIVQLLLSNEANINRVFPGTLTPLKLAEMVGNSDVLKLLNGGHQSSSMQCG